MRHLRSITGCRNQDFHLPIRIYVHMVIGLTAVLRLDRIEIPQLLFKRAEQILRAWMQ